MSNSNQICFYTESGDTNSFGSSVAINDKYMAVGDPNANRVVIYQREEQDQWYRSRVIYPPENSPVFKAGRGFGRISGLSGNILITSSVIRRRSTPSYLVNPNNFRDFPKKYISDRQNIFQKYVFDLELKKQITQIDCIRNNQKGLTNFYILHDGKLKLITLPNNNEDMFGASIAVHNDLMLVGSPPSRRINSSPTQGKGWLFDLNNLNSKAKVLTTEKAYFGKSVALSSQFAVVGNSGTEQLVGSYGSYPKTLIMSLENDSSSLIDNQGYLSIHKNILAIMRPRSGMQLPLLQLFMINKYSEASLIMERKILDSYQIIKGKYIRNALVQNGWLLTIEEFGKRGSLKICLESLEQIIGQ